MTDFAGPASATNAVTARPSDGRQWGPVLSWFKNCSSPSAQDGTEVDASWLNQVSGFFRNLIGANGTKADGVTPVVPIDQSDNMVLNGILQLIQRGQANWAVDVGTPDALLATPAVAVAEYKAGMRFLVFKNPTVTANATAAPTVNFGLGNLQIVKDDGSALSPGDLKKGCVFEVSPDGAGNARLTAMLVASDVIVPAQAPVTVNVDSTSGSDTTGTGSQTAPFKTNAKAYAYLAGRFQYGTFGATIQMLTPGTYDLPPNLTAIPNLTIIGAHANPAGYVLTASAPAGSGYCCAVSGCTVTLDGLTVNNVTPAKNTLGAVGSGTLNFGNVNLTGTATLSGSHITAGQGGSAGVSGTVTIQQSASSILDAEGGNIGVFGTIAVPSAGSFSNAVVVANHGYVTLANGSSTFSGTTSGKRYAGSLQSTIQSFGGGTSLIPGSSAGTLDAYSQYV